MIMILKIWERPNNVPNVVLTFLTGCEYVPQGRSEEGEEGKGRSDGDQVKFDPFQILERLKSFGNLIFMIFLH